jgi:hypothetical protein
MINQIYFSFWCKFNSKGMCLIQQGSMLPCQIKKENKKSYHITIAIYGSRTSSRMIKYKVRERRDWGQIHIRMVFIQTNRSKHQLKRHNDVLQSSIDNIYCALNNT